MKIKELQQRDVEIEVVYKFKSDKLQNALLIFKPKVFVIVDAEKKTKLIDKVCGT